MISNFCKSFAYNYKFLVNKNMLIWFNLDDHYKYLNIIKMMPTKYNIIDALQFT